MDKLLLVDGNSIINRAFYGMAANMLVTKEGFYTNAIYGFLNILERFINEDQPTHIGVAFDLKGKTFRHEIFDDYKAGRKGMPQELAMQMPVLKDILKAMKIPIFELENYEADDLLGTLALNFSEKDTVILTGDRDMLQLVSKNCTVKIPSTAASAKDNVYIYDLKAFEEEFGITPHMFIDVKAIMGDKSDNIPGVRGIGQVGALKLIKEYKTIENIYENLDKITNQSLKNKLIEDRDQAFLSKELAEIKKDAPLGNVSLDSLKLEKADEKNLLDLFIKLEFNSFIQKFNLDKIEDKEKKTNELVFKESKNLSDFYHKPIYLHTSFYQGQPNISIMNDELDIMDISDLEVNQVLADVFKNGQIIISHYIKELFVYAFKNDIQLPKNFYDTATALYLLDSMKDKYDIDDSYRLYNIDAKQDDPICYKLKYLYQYSKEEIEKNHFNQLFYDIELPLVEVLAYMEFVGIGADKEYLIELSNYFDQELNITAKDIFDYAGETFNINSPKQLGNILFNKLDLPKPKINPSGSYSTSVDVLEKLTDYPIVEKILYYRTISKLNSTYAQGLLSAIEGDMRIHSNFKQTVTATGRISSTEPNLQNIPIRTEIGRKIRKAFVPKEGYTIISGDYSQIELRILAHISQDDNMIDAFLHKQDIHTLTAAKVFNISPEQVGPEERHAAKAVNFGIVYGISDFSLAKDIKTSVKEAGQYIKDYLNFYSGVKKYMQDIVVKAKDLGYVDTLYGRRRYIPELSSPKFAIREFGKRVALNAPIQGSAADIIKIAMVNIYKEIKESGLKSRLILQVHDELVIETHESEVELVRELMERHMKDHFHLSVPLEVEISQQNSLLKG